MRRFLEWVIGLAEMLGGSGLFLVAFLDSSFLSFPEVVDILMMGLVIKYPHRLVWYAMLPTVGSLLGCYVLFTLARRGGDAFLKKRMHERHVERGFAVVRKYGILAVAIPSILPPPVPFKLFVLAAGAARVRPLDFIIAVALGRGVRFFGEALLAAWYGEAAIAFLHEHAREFSLGLVVVLAAGSMMWLWWSRRRVKRFDS